LEGAVAWFYEQHQLSLDPSSSSEAVERARANGFLTVVTYRLTVLIAGIVGIVYYFLTRSAVPRLTELTVEQKP